MEIESILKILKKEYKKYTLPAVSKYKELSKNPYRILISTIISLRTKDKITAESSIRLFSVADNPKSMVKLKIEDIENAIYPAGFYRNKAKSISETSSIILKKHNGIVPDNIDDLLNFPGVGRKTANLVLSLGYNIPAICVDTHVHRISNRIGFVKTKSPEETEFALMKILPKRWWISYNDILVTWGQNVCKPINPLCIKCALSDICRKVGVK